MKWREKQVQVAAEAKAEAEAEAKQRNSIIGRFRSMFTRLF